MSHNDYAKIATDLLAPVRGAWLEQLLKAYRDAAVREYERFVQDIKANVKRTYPGRYVKADRDEANKYRPMTNAEFVILIEAGKVAPNIAQAEGDAKEALESAERDFAARFSEKLDTIFGGKPCDITGELRLRGLITGNLKVSAEGIEAAIEAGIRYNYRYGENSANGRLTVYSQYPFIVRSAKVGELTLNLPSPGQVAFAYRGVNPEQVLAQKASEAKLAKQVRADQIRKLEREKRLLDDIYFSFSYSDKQGTTGDAVYLADVALRTVACAKLGIPMPANLAESKAALKATREALKAVKAAK